MIKSTQEIKEMMGWDYTYNLTTDKFIKRCERAKLIIELVKQEKGKPNLYNIIEDNRPIEEEWTEDIINKDYLVSKSGFIKNKKTGRFVGSSDHKGYLVALNENGNNIHISRHIFFSFNTELYINADQIAIDHINGIRTDNRLDNLRALTIAQNNQMREDNQNPIKSLTTQLVLKYGYDETLNLLKSLL